MEWPSVAVSRPKLSQGPADLHLIRSELVSVLTDVGAMREDGDGALASIRTAGRRGPRRRCLGVYLRTRLERPGRRPTSSGAGGVDSLGCRCLLYTSPSPRDGLLSRM